MSTDPLARLFVALWPDADVRRRLLVERDRWAWTPASALVPVENLHLTVHFIGAVLRPTLPGILSALEMPMTPFDLEFGRPATWHEGIAVMGPRVESQALRDLHAALGAALVRLHLPVERRRYRPHVTFARKAAGSTAPSDVSGLVWPVRGFALVESQRDGGYEPLKFYGPGP